MDTKATIKELIDQAKSTRHLVHEVAAAYMGTTPDNVVIATREEKRGGRDE